MNVVFKDGSMLRGKSPASMCTGYHATSLIMKKGDFESLRQLAKSDPEKFDIVMQQLEARFQ